MIRRKTIASDKAVCAASDIRRTMPDATLARLIMPTKILPIEITTHLTALFWVELRIRQHKAAIHYQRLPGGVICAL